MPKDAATDGSSWSNEFSIGPNGGSSLVCISSSAYRGKDVLDGSPIHKIDIKTDETIAINGPKDQETKYQRGANGTACFDAAIGRMRRMDLSMKEDGWREVTTSVSLMSEQTSPFP